jgi:hypothetical protein
MKTVWFCVMLFIVAASSLPGMALAQNLDDARVSLICSGHKHINTEVNENIYDQGFEKCQDIMKFLDNKEHILKVIFDKMAKDKESEDFRRYVLEHPELK